MENQNLDNNEDFIDYKEAMKHKGASARMKKYLKGVNSGLTKAEAKRQAGYSESYPAFMIERAEGFQKLLEVQLKDEFLTSRHHELINQDQDRATALRGVDMAYKLKSKYPKEEESGKIPEIRITFAHEDEELNPETEDADTNQPL
jgi:hypothetical protein